MLSCSLFHCATVLAFGWEQECSLSNASMLWRRSSSLINGQYYHPHPIFVRPHCKCSPNLVIELRLVYRPGIAPHRKLQTKTSIQTSFIDTRPQSTNNASIFTSQRFKRDYMAPFANKSLHLLTNINPVVGQKNTRASFGSHTVSYVPVKYKHEKMLSFCSLY